MITRRYHSYIRDKTEKNIYVFDDFEGTNYVVALWDFI